MKSTSFFLLVCCLLLFGCDPLVNLYVENQTDSAIQLSGVLKAGQEFDRLGLSSQDMATTSLVLDSLPSGEATVAYELAPGQLFPIGQQIGLKPDTDFQSLHLSWQPPFDQDSLPPIQIRLSTPQAILAASQEVETGTWIIAPGKKPY